MRNLLLASAFLAMATFSRAGEVVTSQAFDEAPALNAPLSGPAFIDPVFPVAKDEGAADDEIAQADPKADLDMPGETARWSLKDASKETLLDSVKSDPATDNVVWLR